MKSILTTQRLVIGDLLWLIWPSSEEVNSLYKNQQCMAHVDLTITKPQIVSVAAKSLPQLTVLPSSTQGAEEPHKAWEDLTPKVPQRVILEEIWSAMRQMISYATI